MNTGRIPNLLNLPYLVRMVLGNRPLRQLIRWRKYRMLDYPEVVDLQAVTTLVDIVKNRQIMERKQEFAKAGWNVQGYLQRIFIGDPGKTLPGSSYAHSGALQDALEDLEETLDKYQKADAGMTFTAKSAKDPEDIGTVLLIITTVLNLLKALGFIKKNRETENYSNSGVERDGRAYANEEAAEYPEDFEPDDEDMEDFDEEEAV